MILISNQMIPQYTQKWYVTAVECSLTGCGRVKRRGQGSCRPKLREIFLFSKHSESSCKVCGSLERRGRPPSKKAKSAESGKQLENRCSDSSSCGSDVLEDSPDQVGTTSAECPSSLHAEFHPQGGQWAWTKNAERAFHTDPRDLALGVHHFQFRLTG